ncbi:Cytoplasmic GTPase/eEF2-like protein (ribosomal biogenesis) [Malassezia sp. CBS 17886]|nr:Cytoplasmic GTPase/eEF2-like protein (ribosomal biogenesis) [Malassezia sp. CBS 17886]
MPPVRAFASENIRCCTLIGHVDHGKSSYADSLLAANGIISSRSAGQVRYLDSREDEQERGITMESSAVSLTFKLRSLQQDGQVAEVQDYTLNLVDTPGHVDFSSEVSTAARLCDGALVVVDVVEGVCSQTVTVLRQAWLDGLRTVLVVNKMDRLVTELKLSPSEAHHRLLQLVEQVNAVVGGFYAAERMEHDQRLHEERAGDAGAVGARAEGGEEAGAAPGDDDEIYFDPARGNVIFASAVDHWAFRVDRFAVMYAQKLGISDKAIRQFLWGNYYLDPKTKRVLTQTQKDREKRTLKPMFVQFVLDNIWRVYENTVIDRNAAMVDRIISTLQLSVHPRDLRAKDASALLHAIMSQWLPLSSCTFAALVHNLPAPPEAQRVRVPRMLRPEAGYFATPAQLAPHTPLERDLFQSRSGRDANQVAYVSKLFSVRGEDMPENRRVQLTADEMRERGRAARDAGARGAVALPADASAGTAPEAAHVSATLAATGATLATPEEPAEDTRETSETVLGFARLYCGTIALGDTVYAVLPKYNPAQPPTHPANEPYLKTVSVRALYMMMGRELLSVERVPAGNLFAVRGVDGAIVRNGTLLRAPDGALPAEVVNLAGVRRTAKPIVRVALEPRNPADMPKLAAGLALLNQADPCVEVTVLDNGEHVILTAGELHLERCLKDLRERFARCAIQQSPPLVPFRETAVRGVDMAPPKTDGAARGVVRGSVPNGQLSFTVRAVPLPAGVAAFLAANTDTIRRLQQRLQGRGGDVDERGEEEDVASAAAHAEHETSHNGALPAPASAEARRVPPAQFWPQLTRLLAREGGAWGGMAPQICAFGPRGVGANILVDAAGVMRLPLQTRTERALGGDALAQQMGDASIAHGALERELCDAVETGFQLAALAGPLCAEPMQGLAFVVQDVQQGLPEERARTLALTSTVISSMREACRNGLLDWSPRLMLAMYACDIQAAPEVQGKVHAVLSRRRGRIVSEEMPEGTLYFTIRALLPVVESFGFADEIRTRTSGAATPQLIFAGFHLYDQDPFWVPRTEEELEDLGEKGDRENVAKRYMDMVRKRKGLFTNRRIVESAEKQRTLKSN